MDSRSPTQAIRHSQQGLYPSELYPWDPTVFSILLSRESYLCTSDSSQGLFRLSEVDVHFPQQSTRALRLCVANDKGHYMLVWIQTEASGLFQVTRDRMVAAALTVAHGDPGKSSRDFTIPSTGTSCSCYRRTHTVSGAVHKKANELNNL